MWCELVQCELPVVHQKNAVVYKSPVAEHFGTKPLRESPYVVSTMGEIEVGVLRCDMVVEFHVKDASLGQIVGVVINKKTAAVRWHVEIVCRPWVHGPVRALQQEVVEGILCTVEIPRTVWVSDGRGFLPVQQNLLLVKNIWNIIHVDLDHL